MCKTQAAPSMGPMLLCTEEAREEIALMGRTPLQVQRIV
jgi:hypothetical protein